MESELLYVANAQLTTVRTVVRKIGNNNKQTKNNFRTFEAMQTYVFAIKDHDAFGGNISKTLFDEGIAVF